MINIIQYVSFLMKHQISASQFLLMYLLYKKEIALIHQYIKIFRKGKIGFMDKIDYDDLIAKGFIKEVEGQKGKIILTDKFKSIFIDVREAVEEIYDLYPAIIISAKGVKYPLTLYNREEFIKLYTKILETDIHDEIVKDLEYAVKNDLIFGKIDTFFTSKFYLGIRKIRNEGKKVTEVKIGQDIDHEFGN